MASDEMTKDLQFDELIKDYSPAEQFLARQIRDVKIECQKRATCYTSPTSSFSRKQIAVGAGGVTSIAIIVDMIRELLSRNV